MSFLPVVNVESYGAVHDGTTDDSTAINNAIAALPATGGIVYFPAGDYAIASTINIGNGSSSAISTVQGIYLLGAAAGELVGLASVSPTGYGAVRLKWTGSAGGTMVLVSGPLTGWGLGNMTLAAQGVAGYCLRVISGQNGVVDHLGCDQATVACITTSTVLVSGVTQPETMYNNWTNVFVRPASPGVGGTVRGIVLDGEATHTHDTTFDTWEHVSVVLPAAATGRTAYGILFERCDSITFRDLHFAIDAGFAGTIYPLVFDYSAYAAWPSDIIIDAVTLGDPTLYTAAAVNSGSPSGATSNRVVGLRTWHVANPGLSNLSWGYTAANP